MHSKAKCYDLFKALLVGHPSFITQDGWETLCSLLAENKECREEIWSSFAKNLPLAALGKGSPEVLLGNDLLPTVLLAEAEAKERAAGVKEIVKLSKPSYINRRQTGWGLRYSKLCAQVMDRPSDGGTKQDARWRLWDE